MPVEHQRHQPSRTAWHRVDETASRTNGSTGSSSMQAWEIIGGRA
jgi:hypothetical protein